MNIINETVFFDKGFLRLADKIEYPVICLSLNHKIVFMNSRAERLFDTLQKQVLNRSFEYLLKSNSLKTKFPTNIKESNKLKIIFYKNESKVSKKNNIVKLNWKIEEQIAYDGNLVGYVVYAEEKPNIEDYLTSMYKELTGQKNVNDLSVLEYAKEIRNYYESIISRMPGNVFWINKNGEYLGCNDNVADFIGLSSREEIVGLNYEEIGKIGGWSKKLIDSWKKDDLEVMSTGKPKLNKEGIPVKMPDGSTVSFLTNRVPLFDNKNNVIGMLGISIDISDKKRARKLQRQKELAEKTAGIMEMLGGSIAHELRTPLATIKTYLQLLEKTAHPKFFINNTDREDIKKRIGIFEQCTRVIDYVIKAATKVSSNILVKLRSLATGTIERRNFKKSSIRKDIQEAVKTYPYQESEKGKVHVVKGEDFYYYGDPSMTEHVLYNIIKNALRAIQEAKKGDITIKVVLGNEYHKLVITDTAIGVSKAMCKKMFEKFATITENSTGTGLGLAFCRMVMQSYGGDIVCNSKKGEFTQFVLTFPVLKFIGHRLANPRTLEKKLKASFREF